MKSKSLKNKVNPLNWDLTTLYQSPDDQKIKEDFQTADQYIEKLKTYRGKIADLSPSELLELIKTQEDLGFLFHKISLFAGLLEATNVGIDAVTRFSKQIDEQIILKSQDIIFISVELSHLPEAKWQEFLKAPELRDYYHFLEETYKHAKHILSEPEEKILSQKSQTSGDTLAHLFSVTTNTLLFNVDGEKKPLDAVLALYYSPDPKARKQAALLIHEGLKSNDKTTPPIYNALIQDKAINDRLRHFAYPEEARFMNDEVDKETVEAMTTTVSQSYDLIRRYYKLKKQILGVNKLYWWDRYAPLPEVKTKINLDEAKAMVDQAYREFSPKLADIVQEMYDQSHIDWLPSDKKRGGAFCAMSGRHLYPYVLMNYTETPRDVMTLAHELGHAVHDVLSQAKNVFVQTHPSLAVAEIASTFGECLLFEKLIASDISREDRLTLLMAFIEDSFSTIYRQVSMFQFEQAMHTKRRAEGEVAKEEIDTLWHDIMQEPFAESLIYTDEHKNTWMYIPHIINSPFYVYSYAFAKLCVLSLLKQFKEIGDQFIPTYLKLLETGGSLSPKDNLAQAGLDISSKRFWQDGLAILSDYIGRLEATVNDNKA